MDCNYTVPIDLITVQIWFGLTIYRKYFSVCVHTAVNKILHFKLLISHKYSSQLLIWQKNMCNCVLMHSCTRSKNAWLVRNNFLVFSFGSQRNTCSPKLQFHSSVVWESGGSRPNWGLPLSPSGNILPWCSMGFRGGHLVGLNDAGRR